MLLRPAGLTLLPWDDVAALIFILILSTVYAFYGIPWMRQEEGYHLFFVSPQREDGLVVKDATKKAPVTRNIYERLKQLDKQVIIFWGSQGGTSQRLAKLLAQECKARYGISAIADDLDRYDQETLSFLEEDKIVGFIVSTFGEGDPSDNAVGLHEYLLRVQDYNRSSLHQKQLPKLRYFAFGLGNSKYQHYNRFVEIVDETLSASGAQRLGYVGKADELLHSDTVWNCWKRDILAELGMALGRDQIDEAQSACVGELELVARPGISSYQNPAVHTGDHRSPAHKNQSATHSAQVSRTRVLSRCVPQENADDIHVRSTVMRRTYLHVELDLGGSSQPLTYQTGDHVAVWPMNSDQEVLRLANLFGWNDETFHTVIDIRPKKGLGIDFDIESPVPTPTTRKALVRHYLDISGPVSEGLICLLAHFAPTVPAKKYLEKLTTDGNGWVKNVALNRPTFGKIMQLSDPNVTIPWPTELFTVLVQSLPKLRPRYFSIASSPDIDPRKIAMTVGVIVTDIPETKERFYGLATNYLFALHQNYQKRCVSVEASDNRDEDLCRPTFSLTEPGRSLAGDKTLINIRPSPFKLPSDSRRPILMIASGSGIAPFRAFVQERLHLASQGQEVGRMLLFFGCWSANEDCLYADEWQRYDGLDVFEIDYAFSRPSGKKTYVQDRVCQRKEEVRKMLLEDDAVCYICGSIKMAKGVKTVLAEILIKCKRNSELAQTSIETLKANRQLQEDVWA